MKRMAALLAVMGAIAGVVPAAAPAAVSTSSESTCLAFIMLRFCK
ncbi:MAG TPA: hypothetical protein VF587_02010 [Solirubrobacteraceae bacterium]|jgi:hypothetical protein